MNKSVIDSFVDIPFSIHAGKFRRAYIYTGSRHHTLEYCNGGVGDTVERETCTLNIEYGLDPNTTKFNGWNGTLRDPDGETIVTRNAHSRVVDISTYELLLLQLPQPEPYTEHIHALVQRHPYRVSEHQGILVWFPLVILEKEQVREKSMDLDSSQGYWRKADLIQGAGGIGLVICYGVDLHSLKIMYEGIGAHYVLEMDEGGKRALFNGVNGVLRDAYGNAIPCKEISVNQLNVDIDLPPLPVFDDEDLDDNDVDSVDAYNLPDHLAYDFSSDGGGTGAAAPPVIVGAATAADAGQEAKIEQSLPTNSNGIVEHIIERPRYYCALCSFGCLDLSCMQAHQFEIHSKVEMHRTNENNEGAAAQSRHVVFQCQRCHSFKTDLVDELEMHQSQCRSDAV